MTAFLIKVIAIVSMASDHIGLFFFPDVEELRIFGRIAFPLFAWLIATGAYHTKNLNSYMGRIFLLGLVSQVPFFLANQHQDPKFSGLNVLFTLFLGLLAIWVMRHTNKKILWIVATLVIALIAQTSGADYGAFGVLSVVLFYVFRENMSYTILSQIALLVFAVLFLQIPYTESFSIFALFCIALYNKQQGPKTKYLFYIFYPLQYVIIYFIQIFLSR